MAQPQRVGLPGGPQVAQQIDRVGIKQPDIRHIRDRQGEPGALQQPGAIAQIRERGDARGGAAGQRRLGFGQGGA